MILTIFLTGCPQGLSYEIKTLAESLIIVDQFGVNRISKIMITDLQPTEKTIYLPRTQVTDGL